MARPSKYDWNEIKHAYECGKTVDELVVKYGVTKKTLQNKISNELWEVMGNIKADIQGVSDSLGKITGTLSQNPEKAHIIAEDVLVDINNLAAKLDAKQLINGATMMNISRAIECLQSNVRYEKLNVGDGIQNLEPIPLNSSDFKNIQDTIDKAGMTLEIIPRGGASVQIANQNQQSTNDIKIVVED